VASTVTLSSTDPAVRKAASLIEHLFPPPRSFGVRLWDGTELHAAGRPIFGLVVNYPGALRRMFTPPLELSLGEAFIYGDFDIEGDILAAASAMDMIGTRMVGLGDLVTVAREVLTLPRAGRDQPQHGRGPARLSGSLHSLERDRAAIRYHYDVGNDFYALWLDRRMQYSCAYFPTGAEDLDTAQQCKLDHICRKLRLKPGERLLDIGCGWGGLALYAAQAHGVEVLGVTLSQRQAEYANMEIARAGLAPAAAVRIQDYRDLGGESFDKIVSVGMFEHVGRRHLPEYFAQAYRLLKPGGLFLNHGISMRARRQHAITAGERMCNPPVRQTVPSSGWQTLIAEYILGPGTFSRRYVFPDGELTPVSEVNAVAEAAGFEVRDMENLREHYARTLRHWVNRLAARQTEAVKLVGDTTYRTWRLYLAGAAHGFEAGWLNVNQTLLAKLMDGGRANVPYSRADLYA
jgi:cyclopropane-fatty-acyl-phospholipid synthase